MVPPTQPSWLPRPTLLAPLFLGVLGATVCPTPVPAETGASEDQVLRLRWRNGDELPGTLLPAEEGIVRFSAKPFQEALDLRTGQLEGIRFPRKESAEASDALPEFEILLSNGDRLDGRLVAIDRDTVTLECEAILSPVTIRRSSVVSISRKSGGELRFTGLGEIDRWTSSGRDRKPTDWFTDLRGEFATHQWAGNLFREISLPERVEVHFKAQFPYGSPSLEVGLLRDPLQGPMIETWDNHLVLTYRTRFVHVMSLPPDLRELELRLFWDQQSGEVRLCDPSGKLLATLAGASPARPDPSKEKTNDPLARGFAILNRNPELKLLSLGIGEWDGLPAPLIDLSKPRLHLRNSPMRLDVAEVTLARNSDRLLVGGRALPLDDLEEMILSPDTAKADGSDPTAFTTVAWHSGTNISGTFTGIGPTELKISPPWSDVPVTVKLDDAREVRFPSDSEPLQIAFDTLSGEGFTLRGTTRLAPSGTEDSLLAWLAPGAIAPVALNNKEVTSAITRSTSPGIQSEPAVALTQARAYLDNDEILTGRLLSVTPEEVHFESRVTGRIAIRSKDLRALDIGTAGRVLEGFRDPEWEEIEEIDDRVILTPETATLNGGGFGNPSLLLGDRIRFDAEWKQSYGAMTLRLFTAGADTSNPSTDLIIAAQGNRLFIGKVKEGGAFSFSGDQIPIVGNKASVDILARPEKVEVRINGKSSPSLTITPDSTSGNGLYFRTGGGWQGWNQADSPIEISNFRIESTPGNIPRMVLDQRAREHSLAIPRALRDEVPTHVLVAQNGDILRGTLLSVSDETVRFRAKEETFDIPSARIATLVWLRPPLPALSEEEEESDSETETAAAPAATAPEGETPLDFIPSHRFVLKDGSRLLLAGRRIDGTRLVGHSSLLGECRLTLDSIHEASLLAASAGGEVGPMDFVAHADWQARFTPDPAVPPAGGRPTSPMVGSPAPPFELGMLDDSVFKLEDYLGTVVVLDFWATWCGPCIKAMPDVVTAVGAFPEGTVAFCAINQGETPPIIRGFLENREWGDTPVGLDFDMKVGRAYQVEGIPHTVVIDREGKVSWVHTGYTTELKRALFEAIAAALSR